jgi:NAD(P)-dependent dehydrogenase (short-subunit alcohol dehydrogenase family)
MPKKQYTIVIDDSAYQSGGRLQGRVAIITGADSGIGAATAIAYAKEGAKVVINYLESDADALHVENLVKKYGGEPLRVKADLRDPAASQYVVDETLKRFSTIDILINNAGTQVQQSSITHISDDQLQNTFKTNVYGMFYMTQAVLPHLQPGASIINTSSVTAYRGSDELLDYSSTKGAIVSFTRSLSQNLAKQTIRVNAVAPGPVWTPLVISSFDDKKLAAFGTQQPLGWAAQPIEIAPAFVFLASRDARYITGQVMHVNGGEVING